MKSRLRDLTNVETIYRRTLQTVRVRLRRTYSARGGASEPRVCLQTVRVRRRRSYAGADEIDLITISTPADLHAILRAIYNGLDDDQAHFLVLVLNAAGQVVGYKLIGSGGPDHVYDCKVIFRNALLLGAHSIIVAHNHPSGSLVPSAADLELTSKLAVAGKALDIILRDHFILAQHAEPVSLYQKHPKLFDAALPPIDVS